MSDLYGGAKITMIFNYAAFNLKEKLIAVYYCGKIPIVGESHTYHHLFSLKELNISLI